MNSLFLNRFFCSADLVGVVRLVFRHGFALAGVKGKGQAILGWPVIGFALQAGLERHEQGRFAAAVAAAHRDEAVVYRQYMVHRIG